MKTLLSIVALLAAPIAANACDPIGVASFAVQSHCAPVQVQSFGVQSVIPLQVQTVQPLVVQSFAVQAFAVPEVAVVQNVVRVKNVRQPRQIVRQRSVNVLRVR